MTSDADTTVDHHDPQWPPERGPYVLLVDASSSLEARLIAQWFARVSGGIGDPVDVIRIPPSRRRRPFSSVDPIIDSRLAEEDDPLLVPVRVSWLAQERDGVRRLTLRDAVRFGDPRDPNTFQQRLILNAHPDRCRIIVGQPARKSEIIQRWVEPEGRGPADGTTLGEYVALRAWLALERAERRIRGQRYKVPRFLEEDLFWSRPFQHGVKRLADIEGKPIARLSKRTKRYLKEISAQHSPFVIDIVNAVTTVLIRTAHQSVDYSPEALQEVVNLGESHPLVYLPSHKSNFDHLVFQHVLFENELPLNHTAGGINMNFFLVGPLLRRSGIFFIRREFKTNEAYKFVLRQYLDYLLEKRFALEWYIEGGRSRTGKLREPRLGLLAYVSDAYQRGIVDDVVLVPVSINYDQISDVGSYAAEQRGRSKESESLMWALKFISRLRRRNGSIHIRFGEPLPLSTRIGKDDDLLSEEGRLALPKVAFEVSTRINDVTPITGTGLVTLALLYGGGRGFTVDETIGILEPFLDFVIDRNLPTTFHHALSRETVAVALEALEANDVVERTDGLTATVWSIGSDQYLEAAYYRNTIIHFFITIGITELALAIGVLGDLAMDEDSVVERALELRDLLKFEFFFSPKKEFADEVRIEIDRYRIGGSSADGPVVVDVAAMSPAKSPIVLRPFIESYYVVACTLLTFGEEPVEVATLQKASLAMGEQLFSQGVIRNHEAVSTTLFASGVELVGNRDLLDGSYAARRTFKQEITDALEALESIALLRNTM
jgi:glycerol-3-phosphate O-acyltransferase